jgi:hypothetical protein
MAVVYTRHLSVLFDFVLTGSQIQDHKLARNYLEKNYCNFGKKKRSKSKSKLRIATSTFSDDARRAKNRVQQTLLNTSSLSNRQSIYVKVTQPISGKPELLRTAPSTPVTTKGVSDKKSKPNKNRLGMEDDVQGKFNTFRDVHRDTFGSCRRSVQ